jgi:hypothetical protein
MPSSFSLYPDVHVHSNQLIPKDHCHPSFIEFVCIHGLSAKLHYVYYHFLSNFELPNAMLSNNMLSTFKKTTYCRSISLSNYYYVEVENC